MVPAKLKLIDKALLGISIPIALNAIPVTISLEELNSFTVPILEPTFL